MPENETVALEQDDTFWRKAAWLLIRRGHGGEVVITDEEWARVPEEPELILARTDGAMRWIAQRRYTISLFPVAADLDPPQIAGQLPLPGTEAHDE